MYNIAAVGDKDSIYGLASLGLHIFPEGDPAEAAHLIHRLADSGYAVIYVTELIASQIAAELDRYRESPLPAIVPIPGVRGNTGLGMASVSRSVEQAVGSDILK